MAAPVRTTVRQSLLRPQLMLGAERELVFSSGIIAAIMIFSLGSLALAAVGAGVWVLSLAIFQRMAKADPQLTRVYIRHVNRKIYYPAAPHVTALEPLLKPQQKA